MSATEARGTLLLERTEDEECRRTPGMFGSYVRQNASRRDSRDPRTASPLGDA